MRVSTARVISLGIGIGLQSKHVESLRADGPALSTSAVAGELATASGDALRADAHATPPVSAIKETAIRARRTIWMLQVWWTTSLYR
jgi:hypothetical protein